MTSIATYEAALRDGLGILSAAGADVVSVLLYGSMARGDVRPGKSDVLDAFVFLGPETFADRERFATTLQTMVDACERLSRSGLPFHPFLYWGVDEPIPAVILSACKEENLSRIVTGEDIREGISATPASRAAAQTAFFEARRLGYPLMSLAQQSSLDKHEVAAAARGLAEIHKYVTLLACLALGVDASTPHAVQRLNETVPGVRMDVLAELEGLRDRDPDELDGKQLLELLRRALAWVEEINDEIVTRRNATA